MEAYYLEIRAVHITAALLSGSFFLLRALGLNAFRASWPLAKPVRRLSYSVDTVLVAAAILLMLTTHQYPFVTDWLTVKVVLILPVYVVLGYFALRAKSAELRFAATVGAAAAFLFIVSIARTHNPLGVFAHG